MKGVSSVQVDKILQWGSLLADRDSSYLAVTCKGCGTAVGRRYTRVPEDLALLAAGFTLSTQHLQSHTLGSSEVRLASGHPAPTAPAAAANPNSDPALTSPGPHGQLANGNGAAKAGRAELEARLEQLEADLIKVQNILLLHDERLEDLQACAAVPPPGQPAPSQAPPDQAHRQAAGSAPSGSVPITSADQGRREWQDAGNPHENPAWGGGDPGQRPARALLAHGSPRPGKALSAGAAAGDRATAAVDRNPLKRVRQ
ncbi:hypothetical protein WJX81_003376 [Elliptochloris bilobata]|uniref:Mis18 domain-containing protein n=1 Tax=Elliptochloris bilobata TaxID=381761 RepID=A0AAW1RCK5_9CHLO